MSSTSGGLLEVAEEWPSNSSDIKEREGGREREVVVVSQILPLILITQR